MFLFVAKDWHGVFPDGQGGKDILRRFLCCSQYRSFCLYILAFLSTTVTIALLSSGFSTIIFILHPFDKIIIVYA